MKFPLSLLAVAVLLSASSVRASDDMLIYSDRFNNGRGDSWSWMPTRYATNNPVYAGSNAMACVSNGQFQAWWLRAAGGARSKTVRCNK